MFWFDGPGADLLICVNDVVQEELAPDTLRLLNPIRIYLCPTTG